MAIDEEVYESVLAEIDTDTDTESETFESSSKINYSKFHIDSLVLLCVLFAGKFTSVGAVYDVIQKRNKIDDRFVEKTLNFANIKVGIYTVKLVLNVLAAVSITLYSSPYYTAAMLLLNFLY